LYSQDCYQLRGLCLLRLPRLSSCRPYLHTLLRHSVATSPSLILRAVASSALLLAVWETAHVVFDVYATHPLSVSHYAPKPNQALLSGLYAADPYFQQFAFQELAAVTLTNEARRKTIFSEIKKDASKGGAWYDISRACLKLIGEELQRAKGRGVIAPQMADASAAGTGSALARQKSSSQLGAVSVIEGNVFQPTKKTLLDTLTAAANPAQPSASSSAVSTALLGSAGSAAVARVPSIFQTSAASGAAAVASAASAVAPEAAKKVAAQVHTLEDRLGQFAPGHVKKFLFEDRAEYAVRVSVARPREVVWAVQGKSTASTPGCELVVLGAWLTMTFAFRQHCRTCCARH